MPVQVFQKVDSDASQPLSDDRCRFGVSASVGGGSTHSCQRARTFDLVEQILQHSLFKIQISHFSRCRTFEDHPDGMPMLLQVEGIQKSMDHLTGRRISMGHCSVSEFNGHQVIDIFSHDFLHYIFLLSSHLLSAYP